MLIHKPEEIPFEVAAGIPEVWITAIQAMEVIAGFTSSKFILWHGGVSSVSIAGIQLRKALRASAIYVTVGSQEKDDFCKSSAQRKLGSLCNNPWPLLVCLDELPIN
jgi:NADPH:quinone reductase-like Zn-dependent oxidoreductase